MFKRAFWLMVGLGFGFGMSFWVTRTVRAKMARYTPETLSAELSKVIRSLGSDLRKAVSEGAEAMRDREAELREQVGSTPAR